MTCLSRIDERDDTDAIQDYLLEKSGQRTVPSIWISESHPSAMSMYRSTERRILPDQEFIGGSSDLISLESKGQLAPKLGA